jgi:RNA polymerase-binding transcription factor DksA
MNVIKSYNSYTSLSTEKKSVSSTKSRSKVSIVSLTPKSSKRQLKRIKPNLDLSSTILNAQESSQSFQLQSIKNELSHSKMELVDTIKSYENKLKNAEFIINLLRDEIKAQFKDFKKEVSETQDSQVKALRSEILEIKSSYEQKIKKLENQKLCVRCKAFVEVTEDIRGKKELYKYLF